MIEPYPHNQGNAMTGPSIDLTGWQPPSNFQQVASKITGITVFAPQSALAQPEQETNFKCPNCGASTKYDVSAGGVACEHCGYTVAAVTTHVGRQAQTFEFTLSTLEKATQGWGTERKSLFCENCGAEISLSEGTFSITCPFCASNQVNVRPGPNDQLRPLFLIPFKIQPESNPSRVTEWLGKGWFHPDQLATSTVIQNFLGAYMPFWTFDANISAPWEAEVGYEKQERYYDSSEKSWKTRTVIEWRWESGCASVGIKDWLQPGSTHLSQHILSQIYPFDLSALVTYTPDFLAGWQAQSYDIKLPDAWEAGKNAMRERARTACYAQISTSHVRNFKMTADFNDEAWRYVLLPVYISAYKFEDKVFQVMVNGQTGKVAGQKPVAWWKIWMAIAAMLLPGVLFGLIGLPMLLIGGAGVIPMGIGFVLFIIGLIFAVRLYRQAQASEAA
jgi:DNA-directed RNA polymerase subunit RPC12/RpoP